MFQTDEIKNPNKMAETSLAEGPQREVMQKAMARGMATIPTITPAIRSATNFSFE